MGYGYTQIRSWIGFAHGQIYIGSETHSLDECGGINDTKYHRILHIWSGEIKDILTDFKG